MSKIKSKEQNHNDKTKKNIIDGSKRYLIFSDAQVEFIEKHQKKLNITFTEEEKKLSFI